MIISFSGAQGVGKSTLIDAIKKDERFFRYNFKIPEISSRELWNSYLSSIGASDWKNTSKEQNSYYQMAINTVKTADIAQAIIENKKQGINFIFDRSLLDSSVYCRLKFEEGLLDTWAYDILCKQAQRAISGIDLTYYIPPEFDLVDDGFRVFDADNQRKVDSYVRELLLKWDIPYTVLTGSVEERLKEFWDVLEYIFFSKEV